MGPMKLHGRRRLVTDFDQITAENVKTALGQAMARHAKNELEIRYLFRYYRGMQPVQERVKDVRPDITYNTVINHASEIVSFKVSYLLSDPVVYVSRKEGGEGREGASERIRRFNDYMHLAGKQACDKEIADDFTICGQAFRLTLANPDYPADSDCPLVISTLNPATTGVVYRNTADKHSKPVFAFTYVDRATLDPDVIGEPVRHGGRVTTVWTEDSVFTIERGIVTQRENPLGRIPVVEYLNNEFRMGAFEPVLDLLNDMNVLESNRIEATEQNVQSLMWFNDVDLDEEQIERLRDKPAAFVFTRTIKDSVAPNIRNIVVDMQQADQQVLSNDLYKKMLTIVGMPSTGDGNTADSSNNGSTIVRNGWQHAEARAKDTATLWQRSDRDFLAVALQLCDDLPTGAGQEALGLKPDEIVGKFTRRNYEDIMTKATVLTTLLGSPKVHPEVAYQVANLVPDPEEAYQAGMEWYKEQMALAMLGMAPDAQGANRRNYGNGMGSGYPGVSGAGGANQQGAGGSQYGGAEAGGGPDDRTAENRGSPG